jgi:hypothetical protein
MMDASADGVSTTGALTGDLLEAYAGTHIAIRLPEGTLHVRPTDAGHAVPLAWPAAVHPPVHVITACNPGSVPLAEARNAARQARLEEQLRPLAVQLWSAEGRSPDGKWAEASIAVTGLDRTVAATIGLHAGQLAIFELAEDLRVVCCRDTEVVSRRPGELTADPPH